MKILPQASPYTLNSNAGQFRPGFLRPKQLFTVLLGALLPFAATRASAQNGVDTWVGNTSVNWAGANWSGANNPPASGDGLIFGAAGSSGASLIDNLTTGSAFVLTNITYSAAAPSYLIASGGGFTLGTASAQTVIVQGSANAQTNNDPITLAGPLQAISLTGNLTLGGVISGTGGLSQTGSGTLTLNGINTFAGSFNGIAGSVIIQSNGTYAGGFTVSGGGSLTFATNVSLNAGTYAAAINNGGTLNFNGGLPQTLTGVISGAGNINFSAGGTNAAVYILKDTNTFTGNVTISNTYVSLQNGNGGDFGSGQVAGQTFTINSNGLLSLDIGNIFGGGATVEQFTIIVNQGGILQSTALNSFNNCTLGSIVLNGGTMQTVGNVGNSAQYSTFGIGGTLTAGGPSVTPSVMQMISPGANPEMNLTVNAGANVQSSWTVNPAGINPSSLPDLTCGIRLVNSANSQNAAGILKLGTGVLALTATNSFTGPITVSNGTFTINGGGQLQAGAATLNITNEATFEFNSTASQSFTGSIFQNDGTLLVASGTPTFGGGLTNNGSILVSGGGPLFSGKTTNNGSILVTGGSPLFAGPISGTGSITNNGGTVSISGANSYTGNTTVNSGTLLFSSSEPSVAPVFVNDGGVLGIIASGSAHFSPSTLTLGSSTGAVVQLVLSSTTQAQLTPASIVVIGSNAVVISGNLQPNTSYPVLTVNSGALTGGGTLNFVVPNGVGGSVTPTTALGVTTYTLNTTTVVPTIWAGAVNGTWDINTTANWLAPSSGTKYLDNSPVQFDDNPAHNTGGIYAITNVAASKLSPSFVHITNNSTGYTFSNTVVIAGSTGLTKDGAGSFANYGTDSYTGPTVINGGNFIAAGVSTSTGGPLGNGSTLSIANVAGASLTLNNNVTIGSLSGGGTTGGNVNLGASTLTSGTDNSSQTYGGVISGSGSFTMVGSGSLTLTNTSTLTGTLTVGGGNTLLITNTALGTNNSAGIYTFTAPIVDNGTIVYTSASSQTNTGLVTGTGGLTINGPGTFALANAGNLFTGNIVINGGTLSGTAGVYTGNRNNSAFGNDEVFGRTITVNNGGVLSFESPNVFANSGEVTLLGITLNQGSRMQIMAPTEDEVFTNITLNGATIFAAAGTGNEWWYPSGVFESSIIVGGTSPSYILAGAAGTAGGSTSANGGNGTGFGLGEGSAANYQTPFIVASTGSAGPDLTVTATLYNRDNAANVSTGLIKNGAGTMLLNGTNIFSGPITVGNGSLIIGDPGSLAGGIFPANIVISNGATFTFSSTVPQLITGVISGGGTNIVSGAAPGVALTLSGANTYTGPTIISGGTLFLATNSTIASSSSLTITNGGVLDVTQLTNPLYTMSSTQTLIASNATGTPAINGSLATTLGSKIIPGGTNQAGTLNINGSLTLAVGTTTLMDLSTLSTSDGGISDQVAVNGALTVPSGNSVTLNALSGAANLDQTSDYILFTGTSLVGGFSPGPIWTGAFPANFNHFIITNDVTHSQVRLTYSSVAIPSISSTATTPASGILRNQPILLSVTVVQGGAPISSVSVNLSSVGGAASVPLTLSAVAGVYTNTVVVPPGTLAGNTLLPVTATDSNNNQGGGYVVLTVVTSTETWGGGGTAGQENFDNNSDWAVETGESASYAPGYVGDSLVFAGLGGTAGFAPVMDNNYTVNGVTFSSGATNFNITPANSSSLTLNGGVTNSSTNLQTLAVPIILNASENINPGTGGLILSGSIAGANAGAGLTNNGPGPLTLSAKNTYTGQTVLNAGTVIIPSSGVLASNSLVMLVGSATTANSNTVVKFGGTLTNAEIWIGNMTNEVAAFYQTNGTVALNPTTSTGVENLDIGNVSGSYGYYDALGGSLVTYGIAIGGEGNSTLNGTLEGSGILDVNGVNIVNSGWIIMNRTTGADVGETATLNMYSGSLSFGQSGFAANWGSSQSAYINMFSGFVDDTGQQPINLNDSGNAANTGVMNLMGGLVQADSVIGAGSQLNFNGGALTPSESTSSFIATGSATLYAGGGVLTNGGAYVVTNAQPFLSPTSNGVASVTTFTGGAGYIAPPSIVITNGGGTGATAIAQINPATGVVTNIAITCPGMNYTNTPTFLFKGGGATTAATVTGATLAPNASGPLTFSGPDAFVLSGGSGYFILTGANTYTNATIINGTDVQLGTGGSINNTSAVLVTNSGNFDLSLLTGSYTMGSGQRFEGSNGYITSPTSGTIVMGSGSSIYPGTDGTIGSINFEGNLTMAIGSTANFDLSTTYNGVNDGFTDAGTLTLNGNALHIKAPSTSSSLDTSSDYVLITANAVVGGFAPTPIWDVQPANASGFRVLTVNNGTEVVLRYSTLTPPTGGGTATPSSLVRNGTVLITVTVTNGSNPMSPGGTVTVDTTLIGGSFGQPLHEVGSTAVWTNTFSIAPTTPPASGALAVTITDNGGQIGVAFVPVNLQATTETWDGANHVTDQNWDDGKNWVSNLAPGYAGDTLVFAGSTGLAPVMDQNYTPNNISFASGAGAFVLTNVSDNLVMVAGSSVSNLSTTTQTFGLPVNLSGAATFNAVSGNLLLAQPVGEVNVGSGTLVSAGPDTNILVANNTYSGGTTITSGTLLVADPGTLGGGAYASPMTDNAVFAYASQQPQAMTGVISGTGGIAVNGGGGASTNGVLTLGAANTFTGNISVSNGTLIDTNVEGNGNPVATGLGNAQTAGKTVTIGTNGVVNLAAPNGNEFGYGGVVPQIAFVINQGGLLEVTSGNVQINAVTLNGGMLVAASGDNSLQYPTIGVGGSITSGGTAQSVITNLAGDVNRDYVTLGDGSGAGYQTIFNVASTGSAGADLAIGAQLTDTGAATYGSVFTGLVKAGAGSMLLTAQNVYQGTTTLSNGIITLGAVETAGTSGPLGNSGASNPGSIVFAGGTLRYSLTNQNDYSGRFSTSTNQLISIDLAAQNVTFASSLSGVGGSLTVADSVGGGILTLSATDAYTGPTTIGSNATLTLTSAATIPNTSAIKIGPGATFNATSIPAYVLGATGSVTGSGTANPANFAAGTSVNFGNRPITLNYDGTHPALTISSGTLTLNSNAFTVNGLPLPVGGPYVVAKQTTGNISSFGSYTVTGTAIGALNTGTITVVNNQVLLNIAATTPPTMTFTITGNNTSLNIAWPGAYLGASLLYQSNSVGTGLKTNASAWLVWPGSTAVTNEVIPIAKTNEVFFQLNFP